VVSSSHLAFTGTDAVITTMVGAGAIGMGGAFVLVSRRRRQAHLA
jgi:LPXTG-motif cell wall-anchored protein